MFETSIRGKNRSMGWFCAHDGDITLILSNTSEREREARLEKGRRRSKFVFVTVFSIGNGFGHKDNVGKPSVRAS